ncbi:hypothetical protein TNCT_627451 [Trichonephila clavata]|uniref:Uncharacterized protein n=1 Tax=Trichonephila clavata TaxID=2740835 RepID=A0A8X6GTN6_TRICU|nr:hypothetical protein TNCT_627451 [Trichonephila clavata]
MTPTPGFDSCCTSFVSDWLKFFERGRKISKILVIKDEENSLVPLRNQYEILEVQPPERSGSEFLQSKKAVFLVFDCCAKCSGSRKYDVWCRSHTFYLNYLNKLALLMCKGSKLVSKKAIPEE